VTFLQQAFALRSLKEYNPLELVGLAKSFEFTWELAWKTLKDYLEYTGIVLEEKSPKYVIKKAFEVGIIDDGQLFIDMLLVRNIFAHEYDSVKVAGELAIVKERFLDGLEELHMFLSERMRCDE
jgi:nucleotidyltransferase substrate binding protein (TIGR01987 family)